MSIFGNLKTDGLEQAEDRIGGFQALETDVYNGTVKLAYAGESSGGAKNVTLHCDFGGREYRETIYVTNKKGENFFLNRNDTSKKLPLPGFTVVNDLCMVTTEKEISEQEMEEKIVKIYDFEQRKEVPTSVEVLVEMLGKPITLGILNTLENKGVKQGDGSYADGPEERNVNTIDKVFQAETKMTVQEAIANEGWDADKAEFHDKWLERNKGKTRDKRTIKDGQGGSQGKPGGGSAPASGTGERKTLFGK